MMSCTNTNCLSFRPSSFIASESIFLSGQQPPENSLNGIKKEVCENCTRENLRKNVICLLGFDIIQKNLVSWSLKGVRLRILSDAERQSSIFTFNFPIHQSLLQVAGFPPTTGTCGPAFACQISVSWNFPVGKIPGFGESRRDVEKRNETNRKRSRKDKQEAEIKELLPRARSEWEDKLTESKFYFLQIGSAFPGDIFKLGKSGRGRWSEEPGKATGNRSKELSFSSNLCPVEPFSVLLPDDRCNREKEIMIFVLWKKIRKWKEHKYPIWVGTTSWRRQSPAKDSYRLVLYSVDKQIALMSPRWPLVFLPVGFLSLCSWMASTWESGKKRGWRRLGYRVVMDFRSVPVNSHPIV